ncbi:CBS domain protein, partial [Vibrio parahaemolyticus V-223/04]
RRAAIHFVTASTWRRHQSGVSQFVVGKSTIRNGWLAQNTTNY